MGTWIGVSVLLVLIGLVLTKTGIDQRKSGSKSVAMIGRVALVVGGISLVCALSIFSLWVLAKMGILLIKVALWATKFLLSLVLVALFVFVVVRQIQKHRDRH